MAFQTRGSNTPEDHSMSFSPRPQKTFLSPDLADAQSVDRLVDQITEAVREKLLNQGLPVVAKPNEANAATGPEWKRMLKSGAVRIGHTGETPFQPHVLSGHETLAGKIDHTLLKPEATSEEIKRVCLEARENHFATVCVNSSHVKEAATYLKGSGVKAIAVVGFPLGAASTATKAFEAREAIKDGAEEIDMVINIGALKGKDYALVLDDIRSVVQASQPYPVKVILETSNLSHDEKVISCALARAADAAFVKTSTGFGGGGATAEDVELMRRIVGPEMGVKASGGIRTTEDAERMIAAGADRIGASASVAIVNGTASTASAEKKSNKGADGKKPPKNSLY